MKLKEDQKINIIKILAAVFWFIGAGILLVKGGALLLQAAGMKPGLGTQLYIGVPIFAAIVGNLKARWVMSGSCHGNLKRISELDNPRFYQCFSSGFWVALLLMITSGAILSRSAAGNFWGLASVALLDFSIGFGLLFSSRQFKVSPYGF